MRLTLRTLLAWRDRTLPAPHRDEMEQKVAANAAAPLLSARIDRAVADEMLAAPRTGAVSDVNVVAEYLDNVLPLGALDGFERACLGSDDLLAEVASCHRILAEASLDPGAVPALGQADRARLVQALRTRRPPELHAAEAALPDRASRRDAHDPTTAAFPTVTIPITSASTEPRTAMRSSLAAWLLAVSAVLLLGAFSGVLAWSLGGTRFVARRAGNAPADVAAARMDDRRHEPARPDDDAHQATAAGDAAAPEPPPAAANPTPDASTPAAAPASLPPTPPVVADAAIVPRIAPAAGTPASPATVPAPAAAVVQPSVPPDVAPPGALATASGGIPAGAMRAADGGATPSTAPAQPVARVPNGDALAIAAPPAVAAPTPPQPPDPAPEPAAADLDSVAVVGDDGLLVAPVDATVASAWEAVGKQDRPALPARFLAPPFSRPAVEIDGVRVVFSGGTKAEIRRADDDLPWIVLDVGSVVLGAPAPARVRITAAGLEGIVTVAPGAAVGVELAHTASAADAAEAPGLRGAVGRVHAVNAPVEWRQLEPPPPDGAPLTAVPAASTLSRNESAAVQLTRRDVTPAWLTSPAPADALEREAREAIARALPSGEPAVPALQRLGEERRSERRIAAAATLSLMGDHAALADLLVEDSPRSRLRDDEWLRLERTAVLPLLSSTDGVAAWKAALDAAAPAGAGPVLAAIVDAAVAGDAAPRGVLVAALESPWLVVRRSAWHTLLDVEGPERIDRLRYRPDRPADLNADGVRWWRERIARSGAAEGAP